jgi:hypothetical protein
MQQYTNMRITTMDVGQPGEQPHSFNHSIECIKALLDTVTCLQIEDFNDFSMFDWNIIIHTIASMFEIMVVAINQQDNAHMTTKGLSGFGPYLLRLRLRMNGLSATKANPGDPPDTFCLFHSVLGIIIDKYNAMVNHLTLMADHMNIRSGGQRYTASLCPIMDGSVKNTPYWLALNENEWEF